MTCHLTPSVLTQHIFTVSVSSLCGFSREGPTGPEWGCVSTWISPREETTFNTLRVGGGVPFPGAVRRRARFSLAVPGAHPQSSRSPAGPRGSPGSLPPGPLLCGRFLPGVSRELLHSEVGASFKGINLVRSASPSRLTKNLLTWELNYISTSLAFCYPMG